MEGVGETGPVKPESLSSQEAVRRFDVHQRVQHLVMMVTFVVLVATGMPLKFSGWATSQWWIGFWGGVENTRTVHRIAGWTMLADCLYHLVYIAYGTFVAKKPFPVQMVPTLKDFFDFFQEVRYYLGLAKERPQYGRFNWREKFDYFAIFWGMPVFGASALILMYPVFFTNFLPGWIVPAALVAHGDEAVLAAAWIVLVHLFFNHAAPGIFPLNSSIFTGKVPRERYRKEHALEFEARFGAASSTAVGAGKEPGVAPAPEGMAAQVPLEAAGDGEGGVVAGTRRRAGPNGALRWLRELFSDLLIASGASIILFSIAVVILILVTAVPAGNPYIGFFTFILLPALAATGGMVFLFGVFLTRKKARNGNGDSGSPDKSGGEDRGDQG